MSGLLNLVLFVMKYSVAHPLFLCFGHFAKCIFSKVRRSDGCHIVAFSFISGGEKGKSEQNKRGPLIYIDVGHEGLHNQEFYFS